MLKEEFLRTLEQRLNTLPARDREESLAYYSEIIDDMTENGYTEAEAAAHLGSVEKIAEEILLDMPLTKLAIAKVRPKRRIQVWEIVLLVIGAVVWLPLLIAAAAVVLSVYVSIWTVIISLFASVLGLGVTAVALPIGWFLAAVFGTNAPLPAFLIMIGAALVLAGITTACFAAVMKLTRLLIKLSVIFIRWIKSLLIGKEHDAI